MLACVSPKNEDDEINEENEQEIEDNEIEIGEKKDKRKVTHIVQMMDHF